MSAHNHGSVNAALYICHCAKLFGLLTVVVLLVRVLLHVPQPPLRPGAGGASFCRARGEGGTEGTQPQPPEGRATVDDDGYQNWETQSAPHLILELTNARRASQRCVAHPQGGLRTIQGHSYIPSGTLKYEFQPEQSPPLPPPVEGCSLRPSGRGRRRGTAHIGAAPPWHCYAGDPPHAHWKLAGEAPRRLMTRVGAPQVGNSVPGARPGPYAPPICTELPPLLAGHLDLERVTGDREAEGGVALLRPQGNNGRPSSDGPAAAPALADAVLYG